VSLRIYPFAKVRIFQRCICYEIYLAPEERFQALAKPEKHVSVCGGREGVEIHEEIQIAPGRIKTSRCRRAKQVKPAYAAALSELRHFPFIRIRQDMTRRNGVCGL
jgi:hypothetical protein